MQPFSATRRQFLKRLLEAGGASALVSVLAACAAPAPPATIPPAAPKPATAAPAVATAAPAAAAGADKTVTVAIPTNVKSWDPTDQVFIEQVGFQLMVNEPLVYYKNAQFDLDPRLALSWQTPTEADPKTWTFKLRQGVEFHDGTPFNAQAVDFTWKRLLNPDKNDNSGVEAASRLAKGFESLEIVDDYNIKVHTKTVYPDFMDEVSRVTTGMVSPTKMKDLPIAQASRQPVGTGPFRFTSWDNPDTVVFSANTNYWGQKPSVDRIVLRSIPDAGARVAGLEAGEIDVAFAVPPEELKRLGADQRYKSRNFTTLQTYFLDMLQTKKPFSDLRVRQALNYAIDKNSIVNDLYLGYAKVTDSPLFPGIAFRTTFPVYAYDPGKAKQLLSDAGYAGGFDSQLWFVAYDPSLKSAIQVIANQLGQIGVKVTLREFESSSYVSNITTKTDERDLFITNRSITGTDANFSRLWTKAQWDSDNRGRFFNQPYEDAITQARELLDTTKRAALYDQAQKILWEEAAEVYLWSRDALTVSRANINGFDVFPDASIHMDHVTRS